MSDFKILAKKTIDDIFSMVEERYNHFEVDYEVDNLVIELAEQNMVFIVSIHEPSSQIWLSSPISGAHHYEKNKNDSSIWTSTRDLKNNLHELLEKELSSLK